MASKFFRNPTEVSSSSSSSPEEGPKLNVPRTRAHPGAQGGNANANQRRLSARQSSNTLEYQAAHSSKHRAELLAHALLEEKSRIEAAEELTRSNTNLVGRQYTKDDPEVIALARDRYQHMVNQLNEANVLSSTYGHVESSAARDTARRGIDTISRNHTVRATGRAGSAQLRDLEQDQNTVMADLGKLVLAPTVLHLQPSLVQLGRPILDASRYNNEFDEICKLGQGGFGKVYKALHKLEGCEYAVKKIEIPVEHLQGLGSVDKLLHELRTLARLEHANIVRYYSGWLEYAIVPASTSARGSPSKQHLLTDAPVSGVSEEEVSDSLSSLKCYSNRNRFEDELEIIFEASTDQNSQDSNDSQSMRVYTIDDTIPSRGRKRRDSRAIIRTEQSDSVDNETSDMFSDDSHTMDISAGDSDKSKADASSSASQEALPNVKKAAKIDDEVSTTEISGQLVSANTRSDGSFDQSTALIMGSRSIFMLHIQMSLHPLTLTEFISEKRQELFASANDLFERHCFHEDGAVKILLKVLDGVQYLHKKGIIHRDLKPSNIFLSPHEDELFAGCVDLASCKQCHAKTGVTSKYLSIRIGDFGLVAAVTNETPIVASDSSTGHAVGTALYCPPKSSSVVSEKLDIYALGMIFLELLCHFNTRTERVITLGNAKKGLLPSYLNVRQSVFQCLQGLRWSQEEERLTCREVRLYLEKSFSED